MTAVLPCILFDNVFDGSSSFGSVSFDSSGQSCISITIDKKFHITKFTNLFIMKQHNPFDQNNFSWLNKLKVSSTTMVLNSIIQISLENNKNSPWNRIQGLFHFFHWPNQSEAFSLDFNLSWTKWDSLRLHGWVKASIGYQDSWKSHHHQ